MTCLKKWIDLQLGLGSAECEFQSLWGFKYFIRVITSVHK